MEGGQGTSLTLQFDSDHGKGAYVQVDGDRTAYTRDQLIALASQGKFVGTMTGRHGENDDYDHPQPAIWTLGPIQEQRGRQRFPIVHGENLSMNVSGRHIRDGATVYVDGRRVPGSIKLEKDERVIISLKALPKEDGLHFLQIQNPSGLFSNDFLFHSAKSESEARSLREQGNPSVIRDRLAEAIERGDLKATKRLLDRGAPVNARRMRRNGMTPLSTAVFHGRFEIAKHLVNERKASVSYHNRDGNTPLHLAAFLCRTEMVDWLIEKGADLNKENERDEKPVNSVSGEWNDGLRRFYRGISERSNLGLDLKEVQELRPKIARRLREAMKESAKD